MEPYRENATCPKCLGADVSVVWCAWCSRRDATHGEGPDEDDERMHRTCRRCGYAWDELPAPAPESKEE